MLHIEPKPKPFSVDWNTLDEQIEGKLEALRNETEPTHNALVEYQILVRQRDLREHVKAIERRLADTSQRKNHE